MTLHTPRLDAKLRTLLASLVCTALLAAGMAAFAPRAEAARGMEIALQDDNVFVTQSYFNRERAFRYAKSLGVTRLRINVGWAYTVFTQQRKQRRKPAGVVAYQFGLVDSAVRAAARHGIRVHLSLTGPAPAWASKKRRTGPYKPNTRYYAEFAAAAARYFGRRVDRYSIWNEPNVRGWLSPKRSAPRIYRSLYLRGYKAIKRANPRAKVLIGETAPYKRSFITPPLKFLRLALCTKGNYKRKSRRCPRFKADGYAHHPYDFSHAANFKYRGRDNVTMGTLSRLTRALDKMRRTGVLRKPRGRGRLPVYLTEYGYFSSGRRALSRRKRSKYLKQGFTIALKNRRVKSNLQYLLVSPPRRSSAAYFNLSLISRSGKKFTTYKALRSWYRKYRRKVKRNRGPIRF